MTARPPPTDRSLDAHREFGVINLDKPPGPTSHQVVSWVKSILGVEKAAHAGTLDPKVTGCLPILVGDATRMAQVFLAGKKEYVVVLDVHDDLPKNFEDVIREFIGDIYQKPPRKSAVSRQLRTREIIAIDILERTDRAVLLRVRCEPGTYIRKLCHDIGLVLGVGAHMGELRRTATEPFDDRDLVTLHELTDAVAFAKDGDEKFLREILQPAEAALTHLPAITIAETAVSTVAHGSPIYAPGIRTMPEFDEPPSLVACYSPDGSAVCLGKVVGDPTATSGKVIDLVRVLVDPVDAENQRS